MNIVTEAWRVSLVIPAYNEEASILQALSEAEDALPQIADRFEILVVDDGSRDRTCQVVTEAARRACPHVRLLQHPENRGYGAALRTGFEAARFERIAFTDADCQFDLRDLGALLGLTRHAAIAAGYRVERKDVWQRRFFSWGYNQLIRLMLGTRLRDIDCALKVFRRDALAQILPEARGFFVNTEMVTRARRLGLEVAEIGVRHRPRFDGSSKVSLSDIPRTLGHLVPFWWHNMIWKKSQQPTLPQESLKRAA